MELIHKAEKTIKENKLIQKGDRIIIGLSGGPDSVFLTHLLKKWQSKYRLKILLVHVNHGLREKESLKDQVFVENLAKKFNLPLIVRRIKVKDYQKKEKLSLEEAARNLRYRIFAQICRAEQIKKVFLAHTASDQMETILMNFIRGTSLKGLCGMNYSTEFKIKISKEEIVILVARPLLDCFKEEILDYLRSHKINFCLDRTNQDINFTRNFIRHRIIPCLKKINPSLESSLIKNAYLFRLLNQEIEKKLIRLRKSLSVKKDRIEINFKKWSRLNDFYQRELLWFLIDQNFSAKGIGFVHLEEVVSLLRQSRVGSYKVLPGGLIVYKDYDKIIITNKDFFARRKIKKKKVIIPGETSISEVEGRLITHLVKIKPKKDISQILVDYDKVEPPLYIRSRKKGDYFYPVGLKHKKKIQDFFVDKKISSFLRDSFPLLVNRRDEIIWICGLAQDERFIPHRNSQNILVVEYKNK